MKYYIGISNNILLSLQDNMILLEITKIFHLLCE